jgi:hypothetical protein
LFNGISEGATYGNDWQMNSNYPIVRLTSSLAVYYARTHDWNSTGVRRFGLKDKTLFDLPKGLPHGTYSLVVSANGIASSAVSFTFGPESEIITENTEIYSDDIAASNISQSNIYPNPAVKETNIQFTMAKTSTINLQLFDMNGKAVKEIFNGVMQSGEHSMKLNVGQFPKGIYFVRMTTESGTENLKLIVR